MSKALIKVETVNELSKVVGYRRLPGATRTRSPSAGAAASAVRAPLRLPLHLSFVPAEAQLRAIDLFMSSVPGEGPPAGLRAIADGLVHVARRGRFNERGSPSLEPDDAR